MAEDAKQLFETSLGLKKEQLIFLDKLENAHNIQLPINIVVINKFRSLLSKLQQDDVSEPKYAADVEDLEKKLIELQKIITSKPLSELEQKIITSKPLSELEQQYKAGFNSHQHLDQSVSGDSE